MTPGRVLALARADYLERVRRPAFLVALAFMIYAAYVFLPPIGARYLTLDLKYHRPIYNSAGVAALLTLLSGTFVGLAGFYLVRGGIERDRVTGVGQILAATPLGRLPYLLSKLAAGFAVLASMMLVLWLAGAALQIAHGEDRRFDFVAWIVPLLLFSLPHMLMVAALAVAFDSIPWLRGGLGNVAYFFLWAGAIPWAAAIGRQAGMLDDPFGSNTILTSIQEAARAQFPRVHFGDGDVSMGFHILSKGQRAHPDLIQWRGIDVTREILTARMAWVALALALVAAVSPAFDRFAGAPAGKRRWRLARPTSPEEGASSGEVSAPPMPAPRMRLEELAPPIRGGSIRPLLEAEWALLVRARPLPWKLVALGLVIAGCFVPIEGARSVVVVAAWIWPIFLWSDLGSRERRFGVSPLLFATPRPILRPILAGWLAGFLVSFGLVAPVALRLLLAGRPMDAAALVAGAAFIPALALACGTATGGRKLFEILYLLLWYIGPLNRTPLLDYTGNHAGPGTAVGFGVAAGALFGAALAQRAKSTRE